MDEDRRSGHLAEDRLFDVVRNAVRLEQSHIGVHLDMQLDEPIDAGRARAQIVTAHGVGMGERDVANARAHVFGEFAVQELVDGVGEDFPHSEEDPDCGESAEGGVDARGDGSGSKRGGSERDCGGAVERHVSLIVEGVGAHGERAAFSRGPSLEGGDGSGGGDGDEGNDEPGDFARDGRRVDRALERKEEDETGGGGNASGLDEGGEGFDFSVTEAVLFSGGAGGEPNRDERNERGGDVENAVSKRGEHGGGAGDAPSPSFCDDERGDDDEGDCGGASGDCGGGVSGVAHGWSQRRRHGERALGCWRSKRSRS